MKDVIEALRRTIQETQDNGHRTIIFPVADAESLLKGYDKLTKEGKKIIKTGFSQAMDGTDLWINTDTDEKITINLKDDRVRWDLYCKKLKVTIEVIDEDDSTI